MLELETKGLWFLEYAVLMFDVVTSERGKDAVDLPMVFVQ